MISSATLTSGRTLETLKYVVYVGVILYFGKGLLVPLCFAGLISCLLYPICVWFERKGTGRVSAIIIGLSSFIIVAAALLSVLAWQILDFTDNWEVIRKGVADMGRSLTNLLIDLGVSVQVQNQWMSTGIEGLLSEASWIVGGVASASATSLVSLIIIPVYVFLILFYRRLWVNALTRILVRESAASIRETLLLTINTYYNFIKGMGLVYLIVGILNSIGLYFLDVPHPILLGFLASVLTFIPYVGIMIGAVVPIVLAWATHDSLWYPAGVIAMFAFVQYLEANIIFPIAVSTKLKVNTMAVLIAIFVGGLLWGASGMILFVPAVGIIKLISDRHASTRTLGFVLGSEQEPVKSGGLLLLGTSYDIGRQKTND